MTNTENTTMNTYEFSALRFIPGYGDYDTDSIQIQAQTEEQAWDEFRKLRWSYREIEVELIEN